MKSILAAGAAMIGAGLESVGVDIAPSTSSRKPKKAKAIPAPTPRAGEKRAAARLKAHREAQEKRLAKAPVRDPSRQVMRARVRRLHKMPLGAKQADWHRRLGLPVSAKMKARG